MSRFNKDPRPILKSGTRLTTSALSSLEHKLSETGRGVDTYINPLRTSVLKRFPIVFSLLTTLGVATTFLGFEKLVSGIPLLNDNPLLMLIVGIIILALTGTLYKKLS